MTEITDLSVTDSSNTEVTGESLDGSIANMGRMDNTLQAVMGLLARSIRTNVLRWIDNTDSTKRVALDLSGLPTATTRTWTAPYYSGTLGLVSDIRGQIYGLTLSNNVTDATNDIDIAAGSAVDSTGAVSMLLATALGKRLDAAWAVGGTPGATVGGLDTGAVANATYYVYLIRRPDTGVVDVCFSASIVAPITGGIIPTAYTQYRRIGAILRAGGTILAFSQNGDEFLIKTPTLDVNTTTQGINELFYVLSVPFGIVTQVIVSGYVLSAGVGTAVLLSAIDQTNPAVNPSFTANVQVNGQANAYTTRLRTDTQSRIRARSNSSNTTLTVTTSGWIDTRGRT